MPRSKNIRLLVSPRHRRLPPDKEGEGEEEEEGEEGEELNEYLMYGGELYESELQGGPEHHRSCVRGTFRLKRRVTGVVINTFIPTALICALCHSTVYYGEALFKAVVAVNLTSLLCLVTMFNRCLCSKDIRHSCHLSRQTAKKKKSLGPKM